MSSNGSNSVSRESVSDDLFTGEKRYLEQLWVLGDGDNQQEQWTTHSEKIRDAIDSLTLRERRILVQFWSPTRAGKHSLLTTLYQPKGLGIVDEGLFSYRRASEHMPCIVDEEYEEEYANPPARVFRRGLPEWTLDVTNYAAKHYPQQDFAVRCNLRGSLVMPVFDPSTPGCVGVLEIVMSSKYPDYAYEVQEVHRALEAVNLNSPQVFGYPLSYVANEHRRDEHYKIFKILKLLCDSHNLPLAQTWAVAGIASIVAHEGSLVNGCSSFNKRCIGKVCMSTTNLPFYVRDLEKWNFREACIERHLEKSRGVVGRALTSQASCFCGDVAELGEDEYPLVYFARMTGLSSCFAIYLNSVEGDGDGEYVIELFFQEHIMIMADGFVEAVKQEIENASGMKLGIISPTEVVGGVSINWDLHSPPFPEASLAGGGQIPLGSENLQLMVESEQNEVGINHNEMQNVSTNISSSPKNFVEDDVENSQGRKRKRTDELINLEESRRQLGMIVEEHMVNLHVGQSRLKGICTSLRHIRWPYSKSHKHNDPQLLARQREEIFNDSGGILSSVPINCISSEAVHQQFEMTRSNSTIGLCIRLFRLLVRSMYASGRRLGLRRWRLQNLIRSRNLSQAHLCQEPKIHSKAFNNLLEQD